MVNKSQDPDPPTDFEDEDDDDKFDDSEKFSLNLSDDEKDLEDALARDDSGKFKKKIKSDPSLNLEREQEMAYAEAEEKGIVLLPKTKGQNTRDSDRELWYRLKKECGWGYEKIIRVLGWGATSTIAKGVQVWEHRVELARGSESAQQQPPPQPQTPQQQFGSAPPMQPQFAPQPIQPQPQPPEEEDVIEVPEPEYGPPTLKEELTKLGNIMKDHKIKTETINVAMKALEDNPSRLETPRELHDFFHSWKVSADYNVINIIVDRFFGYHAQKRRHEDRYGPYGRGHDYGPYGGGRYDDDFYDRRDGRRRGGRRRRYDDEYDDYDDDYYDDRRGGGRRGRDREPVKQGMSEEDVEKKILAAREQERALAAKEKEVTSLEARLDSITKELADIRNNPPDQRPMITISRPVRDKEGNVIDEEIVTQPWAPERTGMEKLTEELLIQKLTEKPEPPPAQTGPTDGEMRAREDAIKAEMSAEMEELKKLMGEKELDQITAQLEGVKATLEKSQEEAKSKTGQVNPEVTMALKQMEEQGKAFGNFTDNLAATGARVTDMIMWTMDPLNYTAMKVSKYDAQQSQNLPPGTRQDLADAGL